MLSIGLPMIASYTVAHCTDALDRLGPARLVRTDRVPRRKLAIGHFKVVLMPGTDPLSVPADAIALDLNRIFLRTLHLSVSRDASNSTRLDETASFISGFPAAEFPPQGQDSRITA